MRRYLQLIVFFIFLSGSAQNIDLFERGNAAYGKGNYEAAARLYSEIYENGSESVALHYNLANAYYKLNRVGPSIYHYEKALQLDPQDEDVLNNLEFAKNMTIDSFGAARESGFFQLIDARTSLLTPKAWGWTAIILMLIFVSFFLAYYFSKSTIFKRIFFAAGLLFLILSIGSAGVGTLKQNLLERQQHGIVFSEKIDVRSEPNLRSAAIFTLHEGAKVEVTEDFQGWYEIKMPNGSQGWVSQENLKLL